MDSQPIFNPVNQVDLPLKLEPGNETDRPPVLDCANEMQHEHFCTSGTSDPPVLKRYHEASTYSDDNLSKCESLSNKKNNEEKEGFKSAKNGKLPLEFAESLTLENTDLIMSKNCGSSSENSFESQTEISESSALENQNVEYQSNFQIKLDMDDISSDRTNTTTNDTVSSRIENDRAEENACGINDEESKIDGNIPEDAPEKKNIVSPHKEILTVESLRIPYHNSSNPFEVIVPLIGKNVITAGNIKPFTHRYDLAKERNRAKGLQEAAELPKISYHQWRKQRDAKPQEEKEIEIRNYKLLAVRVAAFIVKVSIRISKELLNDEYDEENIEKHFQSFLRVPISTLALILAPQFIHVMMYIRGSTNFSTKLRQIANKCYAKCHVMFPIPDGYNFETVYTSEVKKNLPKQLDGMQDYLLDYGDYSDPFYEDENSTFSADEDMQKNID